MSSMFRRIVIASACTIVLCLQAGGAARGVSAPLGEEDGVSLDMASVAASHLDPARVLAREGEIAAAHELFARSSFDRDLDDLFFEVRLLAEMKRFDDADSLLARFTPLVDDHDVYLHHLQRAALNFHAGRHHRTLRALAAIATLNDPDFDGYRDYMAMRAYMETQQPSEAVRVGETGRERGLPAALQSDFEEVLVAAYQSAGDETSAIDMTHALQKKARGWRQKARLLRTEYELYAAVQNLDAARRVASKLVIHYPRFVETRAIADEIMANVKPGDMSVDELATYAGFYSKRSRFDEAMGLLKALKSRELSTNQKERSRLLFAQYHYRAGEYTRAVSLAKPSYENPSYKRLSILILARSYRRTNREAGAAGIYEYFARIYPNDGKAAEALFVASHIYRRLGDDAGYRRVLERLTRSYPSSYFGKTATLMAARRHESRGEHADAAALLSRLVKRSKGADEASLFYLSRAYSAAGDKDNSRLILQQLQDLDQFSFYLTPEIPGAYRLPLTGSSGAVAVDGKGGLLEFLERGNRKKAVACRRIRDELGAVGTDADDDTGYAGSLRRGRWFLSVGLREWGESELEDARRASGNSPGRLMDLGQIYDEYAMPWRSVRVYQRVKGRIPWSRRHEFADDFRWLLYPTPYPVQVIENSARHNVPPHLAFAMIREESRFDSDAVSRVGALGLMQIMPATGRSIAREMEFPGWDENDLLDPEINVAFGVWYASSLLEAAHGDPLWMLAAYNAGPGNARRWFDGSRTPETTISTIDNIDFKETRKYVQRIVESANIYHSLYFSADNPVLDPPR